LATILISHLNPTSKSSKKPKTCATIIDTTGSFPLSVLAQILRSRILESRLASSRRDNQSGNYEVTNPASEEPDVSGEVQICLEMVALSRVFDIEGLWEVIGEVGRDSKSNSSTVVEVPRKVSAAHEDRAPEDPSPENVIEIIDSEEEVSSSDEASIQATSGQHKQDIQDVDDGIEVVIIDDITRIINLLFAQREKSEGTSFGSSFITS